MKKLSSILDIDDIPAISIEFLRDILRDAWVDDGVDARVAKYYLESASIENDILILNRNREKYKIGQNLVTAASAYGIKGIRISKFNSGMAVYTNGSITDFQNLRIEVNGAVFVTAGAPESKKIIKNLNLKCHHIICTYGTTSLKSCNIEICNTSGSSITCFQTGLLTSDQPIKIPNYCCRPSDARDTFMVEISIDELCKHNLLDKLVKAGYLRKDDGVYKVPLDDTISPAILPDKLFNTVEWQIFTNIRISYDTPYFEPGRLLNIIFLDDRIAKLKKYERFPIVRIKGSHYYYKYEISNHG